MQIMLPEEFETTRFPGYFWNTANQKLYSIKMHGVLRPLKLQKPNHFTPVSIRSPYYQVSVRGRSRYLLLDELSRIKRSFERVYIKMDD